MANEVSPPLPDGRIKARFYNQAIIYGFNWPKWLELPEDPFWTGRVAWKPRFELPELPKSQLIYGRFRYIAQGFGFIDMMFI